MCINPVLREFLLYCLICRGAPLRERIHFSEDCTRTSSPRPLLKSTSSGHSLRATLICYSQLHRLFLYGLYFRQDFSLNHLLHISWMFWRIWYCFEGRDLGSAFRWILVSSRLSGSETWGIFTQNTFVRAFGVSATRSARGVLRCWRHTFSRADPILHVVWEGGDRMWKALSGPDDCCSVLSVFHVLIQTFLVSLSISTAILQKLKKHCWR